MKKLSLLVLMAFLVIFLAASVNAAGIVQIVSVTDIETNPGVTVTIDVNVTNAGDAKINEIQISSTNLVGKVTIPAPAPVKITNLVNGTSQLKSLTLSVPYVPYGDYTGIITAVDTSNPNNKDTINYTVTVRYVAGLAIDVSTITLTGKGGSSETETFVVKNTGSITLTNFATLLSNVHLGDSNKNNISVSFSNLPASLAPGEQREVTVNADIPSKQEYGSYYTDVEVNAQGELLFVKDTFRLNIKIQPEICDKGVVGDIELDVTSPENNDEFSIGENIHVEADVNNNGADNMNIIVEAQLYDTKDSKVVKTVKSEAIKVKDGDSETFYLDVPIPTNLDEEDSYAVYIKAYEKGNEEKNCNEESIDVDIVRESHLVITDNVAFMPASAACGDSVNAEVNVKNVGSNDESDVSVRLRNSQLKLDQKSEYFDLDQYGGSDDEAVKTFTFNVPIDAKEDKYPIEVIVTFDDGEKSYSTVGFLEVKGNCVEQQKEVGVINGSNVGVVLHFDTSTAVKSGTAFTVPVELTNYEQAASVYNIVLDNIDDWAAKTTPQQLKLWPGQSSIAYFNLYVNEDAISGKHTLTVNIFSGSRLIKSQNLAVDVVGKGATQKTETTSLFNIGNLPISTEKIPIIFWLIADMVLLLIALFFIKLIMSRR